MPQIEDAAHFRNRAENVRRDADAFTGPPRAKLLELAALYDQIAALADSRAPGPGAPVEERRVARKLRATILLGIAEMRHSGVPEGEIDDFLAATRSAHGP